MNKLDSYIEMCKSKGLKPSQIDPPIGRLIRIFYRDLPPLMTLPTAPLALFLGIFFGALFYPSYFLFMKYSSEASRPFSLNLYLLTIFTGPLWYGFPTAFLAKRNFKKHEMPDWKTF